jgi:hypothetical protein
MLGEWCFSSAIRVLKPDTGGLGDECRRSVGGYPVNAFIGRDGTALGNDLGEWCLTPVS